MTESEPGEIPPEALDLLRAYVETEHGFLSWLGFTVETFETDRMVATVPFDDKLTNPTDPPTVHGGVASTLVDTVGGLVLRPYLEDPIGGDIATISLNVNYLRPAAGDLTATGEVVRAGGSVGVAAVEVESETPDGKRRPVVVGQGAYRLFRG